MKGGLIHKSGSHLH